MMRMQRTNRCTTLAVFARTETVESVDDIVDPEGCDEIGCDGGGWRA